MLKKLKKLIMRFLILIDIIQIILFLLKINNYLKITWLEACIPLIILVTFCITYVMLLFVFAKIIQEVFNISEKEMKDSFWDKLK